MKNTDVNYGVLKKAPVPTLHIAFYDDVIHSCGMYIHVIPNEFLCTFIPSLLGFLLLELELDEGE